MRSDVLVKLELLDNKHGTQLTLSSTHSRDTVRTL